MINEKTEKGPEEADLSEEAERLQPDTDKSPSAYHKGWGETLCLAEVLLV